MPPKFDPTEVKIVCLRAVGGEVGAASTLAPKVGPLGLSPKKIGDDIAKGTKDWKGLKVTVKLTIQNRQATVSVVPSASALVMKALKEAPRDRKKVKNVKHDGNITFEAVIDIARQMRDRSMARKLVGTVKEILGTAQSIGCTVDGLPPHDIVDQINEGEREVPADVTKDKLVEAGGEKESTTDGNISDDKSQENKQEKPTVSSLVSETEKLSIDAKAAENINLKDKAFGEIDWTGEIEVQQNDPNSPIYAKCKDFKELGLEENLLKGVYAMNFNKPSKIQETTLPMIVQNPPKDLIAQSQSGTGKTAAFSLVTRGSTIEEQIIIGTPGQLWNYARNKFYDTKKVVMIVFDEADDMFMMGKRDDSLRLMKSLSPNRQALLFSATFSEEVRRFCESQLPRANMVKLRQKELTLDGISQYWVDCRDSEHRYEVLNDIYGSVSIGQVIIFCERVATAAKLSQLMIAEGHSVSALYGGKDNEKMTVNDRDRIMDNFRQGKSKVLITTNVLARGIDINQVNVVVNYDIPVVFNANVPDFETYLHRIGRTGRFGRKGASINFCYDNRSRKFVK
eukprot:Ihof_evm8s6 gene=Ihof_evmTU8s6